MSLIPSESASFSDLLGRGLDASKKSKWRVPHQLDQPPAPPKVEPAVAEAAPQNVVEEAPQPEPVGSMPTPVLSSAAEEVELASEPPVLPGAPEEPITPLHPEALAPS